METSDDFTTVVWRGIRFGFTKMQAAVAKVLIEAAGKTLGEEAVLEKAGSDGTRIRDVFKRGRGIHPAIGQMLMPERKGIWRFVPEDEKPHVHPGSAPGLPHIDCENASIESGTDAAGRGRRNTMDAVVNESRETVANSISEFLFSLAERDMPRAFALALRIWQATRGKPKEQLPDEFNERQELFSGLFGTIEWHMTPGGTLADLDNEFQDLAEKLYPSDEKFSTEVLWRIAKHSALRHELRVQAILMADARAAQITHSTEEEALPADERERRRAEDQRRSNFESKHAEQLDRDWLEKNPA